MAVSVEELARRASVVVDEVARTRREVIVTEQGHPIAAIVPVAQVAARLDELAGRFSRRGAFADLRPEGRSAVDDLIAERREEAAREDAG